MENSAAYPLVLNPQDMNEAFAQAFNSGRIENLLALYEPNAILINTEGSAEQGLSSIRQTLTQLLTLKGSMISRNKYCIPFENIALLRGHFIIRVEDGDRAPFEVQGHTTEVVRQQAEGNWLYIVDHPFGANSLTVEDDH